MRAYQFLDNRFFTQIVIIRHRCKRKLLEIQFWHNTVGIIVKLDINGCHKNIFSEEVTMKEQKQMLQALWRELLFVCATFFKFKSRLPNKPKEKALLRKVLFNNNLK